MSPFSDGTNNQSMVHIVVYVYSNKYTVYNILSKGTIPMVPGRSLWLNCFMVGNTCNFFQIKGLLLLQNSAAGDTNSFVEDVFS